MDVPQENILGEPLPTEETTTEEVVVEEKKDETVVEETVETLKEKLSKLNSDYEGLDKTNKSKDENIRAMGEKIRQLEKAMKDGGGGKDGEAAGLFKDIKRPTDLTKEEREKLTPTEAALMDQVATMQEGMNKLFERLEKGDQARTGVDPAATVKELAKDLAGGNREMANQIIEQFNGLKFSLDGLSEEEILDRVKIAAGKVPTYKPPQDQQTGTGAPVKKSPADASPDVAKAQEAASKNRSGDYAL
jgi:chromosome segregation ATPase